MIGEVVKLQPLIRWFEDRPLIGKRVMVTRPVKQAEHFYRRLRELGAEVLPYPTIDTRRADEPKGWSAFDKIENDRKWIAFSSENGVNFFIDQYIEKYGDIRRLSGFKLAVVGKGTAKALKEHHLKPDFIPQKATSASLAEELIEKEDMAGAVFVRVRGNLSDPIMEKMMNDAGAEIIPLNTYETFHPRWPENMKNKLLECSPDVITFTSGSTVEGLQDNLSRAEFQKFLKDKLLLSIGPTTSQVMRLMGLEPDIEAEIHTVDGMIDTLMNYFVREDVK